MSVLDISPAQLEIFDQQAQKWALRKQTKQNRRPRIMKRDKR